MRARLPKSWTFTLRRPKRPFADPRPASAFVLAEIFLGKFSKGVRN